MDEKHVPIFARLQAGKAGLTSGELTFEELVRHALGVLSVRTSSEIVCGPITTGGFRDPVLNLILFNHAIELLELERRPMFNQMPYEAQLARLDRQWRQQHGEGAYCHPILTQFYLPIFESRRIRRAWFLPGWENSVGATWEHLQLMRLGARIEYLPDDWACSLDVRTFDLHR